MLTWIKYIYCTSFTSDSLKLEKQELAKVYDMFVLKVSTRHKATLIESSLVPGQTLSTI